MRLAFGSPTSAWGWDWTDGTLMDTAYFFFLLFHVCCCRRRRRHHHCFVRSTSVPDRCFLLFFFFFSSLPLPHANPPSTTVDATDKHGATALLYACQSLSKLPAREKHHPLFQWACDLLQVLINAGADVHNLRRAAVNRSISSLFQSVWPAVMKKTREEAKSHRSKLVLSQRRRAEYASENARSSSNTYLKESQYATSPSSSSVKGGSTPLSPTRRFR